MILDSKLTGILDQGAGALIVWDPIKKDMTYEHSLSTVKAMEKVVDVLYQKAKKLTQNIDSIIYRKFCIFCGVNGVIEFVKFIIYITDTNRFQIAVIYCITSILVQYSTHPAIMKHYRQDEIMSLPIFC